jgi:sugar/nucleoside kinase (ribokinase family)
MTGPDAIVAGLICLDIIPHFYGPASFVPGKITEIGAAALSTGGAVSNTGLALHRLGIATGLMGKLGDDLFGQVILSLIRGVDPALVQGMTVVPGETSSYTIVISLPGTDRFFFHCPGANHTFGAEDVNYEIVAKARLFHLGYPPYMRRLYANGGHELVSIYRRVKELGVTTALDMALPDPAGPSGQVDWPALLAKLLPYVDLFLPSAEELCFMLDRPAYDATPGGEPDVRCVIALADRCIELGAKIVAVKCGARGLYARTSDAASLAGMGRAAPANIEDWARREVWSPCFTPEPFVGATGSGDATIAGFLAAMLRGESFARAVTMACAVGACNVEAADALSGIRTWDETVRRVEAGWPRQPVSLPEDWTLQPDGLWMRSGA